MPETIKKKIKTLEDAISSPATPANIAEGMKKVLEKLKGELKAAEEKAEADKKKPEPKPAVHKPEPKPAVHKPEPKPAAAKAEKKKAAPKAKKVSVKTKAVVDGKEVSKSDADYCEKILKAYKQRRAASAASAKKHKTKPVFELITDKIESAVEQGIKNIPAKTIAGDPKKYIASFTKLEGSMKSFMQDFKAVLGKDYDASDVQDSLKAVSELIAKLKAKFSAKK